MGYCDALHVDFLHLGSLQENSLITANTTRISVIRIFPRKISQLSQQSTGPTRQNI